MSIQQLFFNGASGPTSPLTFTETGQFTVPGGVSSLTVKLFGSGGYTDAGGATGGSGAYIRGNYAVQGGDIIYVYSAGSDFCDSAAARWTRSATVLGWAIAGAGGSGGAPGDNGGDDYGGRYGGPGGDAGAGSGSGNAVDGDSADGIGGSGAYWVAGGGNAGGGGGGGGNGLTGSTGGGPGTSSAAASSTNGGGAGQGTNANGGSGGGGGGGYYAGGGGGGGGGRDDYPDSGLGGGGGGGGISYESGNMTSRTVGLCKDLVDSDRGTAGNPDTFGKVVLIW